MGTMMKTTKAQDAILNRLYRKVMVRIADGNQKKTVRSLSKKGLVQFEAVSVHTRDEGPFYFMVLLTPKGINYTQNQHQKREY